MANRVFLNKHNIIEEAYDDQLTIETLDKLMKYKSDLIVQLRGKKEDVLTMIDLSDMHKMDRELRGEALKRIRQFDFDKLAYYGASKFMSYILAFIVQASHKENKIKGFPDKQQAEEWLQNNIKNRIVV